MTPQYVVGNIISIEGLKIIALMHENTNLLSYFYNGETYRGVSISEYVGIIRGPYKIVGKVDKEYLEDSSKDYTNQTYELNRFIRKIEISVIGTFLNNSFEFGIKCFPMIFNEVVLLSDSEIQGIIQGKKSISKYMPFGKSVLEKVDVKIPWNNLFNTHIGIFGNTGSGKSNTLAKLYTELFRQNGKSLKLNDSSKFLFIDFNGEYTKENTFVSKDKEIIKLSTKNSNGDKINISPKSFWDIETLSILFSATEKTQRPFLANAINYFVDYETKDISKEKIEEGIKTGFWNVFKGNNNKESLRLLNEVYRIVGIIITAEGKFIDVNHNLHDVPWCNCLWHAQRNSYYFNNDYINGKTDSEINAKRDKLENIIELKEIQENINNLSITDKLKIIVYLQLIYGLRCNHVQFDHINPLLSRIESRSQFINKIINIKEESDVKMITVVSLKNCNQDAKKMIPLLLAKQSYLKHRESSTENDTIKKTFHLIIDEAHNILSEQSKREEETWKDYRLEVFEEIIKEGRKFGFYLTVSSQRPYDISATIVSQIHNYFIHRLVNELDLKMIGNTINSLDSISKQRIPNLAPGQCIITGTTFDLPLLVQVEKLSEEESPSSDNADLLKLWAINEE